jgi:hypothetical protein
MAIVKGTAVLALVGGLLLLVLFLYFVINPPFRTPETGRLSGSTTRDITLAAGHTTAAALLATTVNDNAFKSSSGKPSQPVMNVTIAALDGGPTAGLRLRLVPGEQGRALGDVQERSPMGAEWTMPCPDDRGGQGCHQRVVILVDGPPASSERRLRLSASAYMQYPAFTPTPGWSSIDVGLSPLGAETGQAAAPRASADGTVELSMDEPVALVPIDWSAGGPNGSAQTEPPGAVLRVAFDAEVVREGTPNGFDAPPPVRLTVLGKDGVIHGRQGVRPGQGGRILGIPLAACAAGCATPYTLAFEWLDRSPGTAYRVTWHAEAIGLPQRDAATPEVTLSAEPVVLVRSVGAAQLPGRGADAPHALEVDVNLAGLPPDEPGTLVHVQLLVSATVDETTEVGAGPDVITPYPAIGGPGVGVPFHVQPGETGSIVVNLEDRCGGARCDRWYLRAGGGSVSYPRPGLPVTWSFGARAWRLTGDVTPIPLTVGATAR